MKSHIPHKKTPRGGDYETIVEQVKQRFGDDIMKSIEEDKDNAKRKPKEKQKAVQAGQPRIDSFFKVKQEEGESSSSTSDSDLLKLEMMKKKLKQELESIDEKAESPKEVVDLVDEVESDSPTLVIDEPVNEVPKPPNPEKRKNESPSIEKSSEKRAKFDDDQSQFDNHITSTSCESMSSGQPDEVPQKNVQEKKRQHEKIKAELSKTVIRFLNPFFAKKMIKNKELFKNMARHITHNFLDQKHGEFF